MLRVGWQAGDPAPELPARAPSLFLAAVLQLRALREPLRLRRASRRAGAPAIREDFTVTALPGMGVGDLSTAPLRRFLRARGFDARGWGLGSNRPPVGRTLERLLRRVEALAAKRGAVALVGWSLGGVLAREVARQRPELVRRVVTLGTPVVGGLRHTALAGFFRLQGWDLDAMARQIEERNRTPIVVPVTAIWSRRDGIVAWQACVETLTPGATNLEADSAHWGLGLDPEVLDSVAETLARPSPARLAAAPSARLVAG